MTIPPMKNSIPATPVGTRLSFFRGEVFSMLIVFILGLGSDVAQAQQTGKIFRIGFLDSSTASSSRLLVDAFRQELSKLGLTEGKNITVEYRYAEGKRDRFPELAAEMVRLKVDLIVVEGSGLALAAKSATTTIPIVVTNAGGLLGLGLVESRRGQEATSPGTRV